MKKRMIFITLLLLILVSAIGVWKYVNSFQQVTVTMKNPVGTLSLDVFKAVVVDHDPEKVGNKIKTLTTTSTLKLKKGSYLLVPSGENLNTAPLNIHLSDEPLTYDVNVPYSDTHLESLVQTEYKAIHTALTSTYNNFDALYTHVPGKLFGRGEWYGATIRHVVGPFDDPNGDTLRVLLKKDGTTWTLLSKPPMPVLSAPDFRDVPIEILRDINKIPVF